MEGKKNQKASLPENAKSPPNCQGVPRTPSRAQAKISKRKLHQANGDGEESLSSPVISNEEKCVKRKRRNSSTTSSLSSPTTLLKPALTERQQMALLLQMTDPQKNLPTGQSPKPIECSSRDSSVTPGGRSKIHKRNERGETPLHLACIRGDVVAVNNLLEQGADIDANDNAGWTPLHEACNHGHVGVVTVLIEKGVNINAEGMGGDTPLHDAVINNHKEVVQLLLQNGANPNLRNGNNQSPLDICHDESISYLLKKSLSATIVNDNVIAEQESIDQPKPAKRPRPSVFHHTHTPPPPSLQNRNVSLRQNILRRAETPPPRFSSNSPKFEIKRRSKVDTVSICSDQSSSEGENDAVMKRNDPSRSGCGLNQSISASINLECNGKESDHIKCESDPIISNNNDIQLPNVEDNNEKLTETDKMDDNNNDVVECKLEELESMNANKNNDTATPSSSNNDMAITSSNNDTITNTNIITNENSIHVNHSTPIIDNKQCSSDITYSDADDLIVSISLDILKPNHTTQQNTDISSLHVCNTITGGESKEIQSITQPSPLPVPSCSPILSVTGTNTSLPLSPTVTCSVSVMTGIARRVSSISEDDNIIDNTNNILPLNVPNDIEVTKGDDFEDSGDDDDSVSTVVSFPTSLPIVFGSLPPSNLCSSVSSNDSESPKRILSLSPTVVKEDLPIATPIDTTPTIIPETTPTNVDDQDTNPPLPKKQKKFVTPLVNQSPSEKEKEVKTIHAVQTEDIPHLPPKRRASRQVYRSSIVSQYRSHAPTNPSPIPHNYESFLTSKHAYRSLSLPSPRFPKDVYPPLLSSQYKLFTEQEQDRMFLLTSHVNEVDRLIVCFEQELTRAYQKATTTHYPPLNACAVLIERMQSQSYITHNASTNTNELPPSSSEHLLNNYVQDVWDKFHRCSEVLAGRHRMEVEALWLSQQQQWRERNPDTVLISSHVPVAHSGTFPNYVQ